MTNRFETWTKTENKPGAECFEKDGIFGFVFENTDDKADDAFISTLIDQVGNAAPPDFYSSWNGQAEVKFFRGDDYGVVGVIAMEREDDEYGPSDSPTFAWRIDAEAKTLTVAASKKFRDTSVTDALGIEWPARESFEHLTGIQGWGE